MIEYKLLGKPIALARPRFNASYKSPHVYDIQKTIKSISFLQIKAQHDHMPLISSPVCLKVVFIFQVPRYFSNKKTDMLNGKSYTPRPDLDNLVKYLADVCKGVIYTDDQYITQVDAKKIYGLQDETIFSFVPIE